MPADTIQPTEAPRMTTAQSHKIAFFRQSGWMMITTVASGALMWGVHFLARFISEEEYGIFTTLIGITMVVPAIPLQMVFTQQSAAALAKNRVPQLAGMIRMAWMGTLMLSIVGAIVLLVWGHDLMRGWKLHSILPLWMTLLAVTFTFWMPIFTGLMQGQQNFMWLGWSAVFGGVGRLGSSFLLVLLVGGQATEILTGVVIGLGAATGMGIWQTRKLWGVVAEPFDRGAFLRQILPLALGFGATQFLFTGDILFVGHYLPDQRPFYNAAGTLARALVWLVGPMTSVMFPKIVHSAARSEKSDLLGLTLVCSAALAFAGVVGLWVMGPFAIKLVFKQPEYLTTATALLPWYALAMLPLCLANVLVNNLMAHARFRVVPVLVVLALCYAAALMNFHASLLAVLKTVGTFNTALLGICALFTWGGRNPAVTPIRG